MVPKVRRKELGGKAGVVVDAKGGPAGQPRDDAAGRAALPGGVFHQIKELVGEGVRLGMDLRLGQLGRHGRGILGGGCLSSLDGSCRSVLLAAACCFTRRDRVPVIVRDKGFTGAIGGCVRGQDGCGSFAARSQLRLAVVSSIEEHFFGLLHLLWRDTNRSFLVVLCGRRAGSVHGSCTSTSVF